MFIRRLMILIFVASACITSAEAQSLFGERTLGRSLSRRTSARAGQAAGAVPDGGQRLHRAEGPQGSSEDFLRPMQLRRLLWD